MTFQLHVQDCLRGMSALASGSVDLVVTSPPYNLGVGYRSYEDRMDRGEYLSWCVRWARQVQRVLKPDGAMFLNLGASTTDPTLPFEVLLRLAGELFRLQNTIHWVKSISIELENGGVLSRGHFQPINSRRFLNDCHEYVFHLTKSGNAMLDRLAVGVPYADKSNVARWHHTGGADRRCGGNVWFVPYRTIRNRAGQRPHPATFPAELAERCIRLHGRRDPVVLDPFLGLGASAEAAQRVGVSKFIGFELDAEYAAFAARRVGAALENEG